MRRGETLSAILRRRGIPYQEIMLLVRASRKAFNLNRMREGALYRLIVDQGGILARFEYQTDDEHMLVAVRKGDRFLVSREKIPYDITVMRAAGSIHSSLFESAKSAGIPSEMVLRLSEIFGWEIDFSMDLRTGDTFRLLYEQRTIGGEKIRGGRILAARFTNRGRQFYAFYFRDPKGHEDYYDLKGRSLRKLFLKSPIRFTRISSGFSKRRYHPILHRYAPHYGIDYAAPKGTPVVSVGDGRVVFAGRRRGYGNFIKIRHNSIYSTTYGHLWRFAKGIRRGRYVRQGQVIGYVGATGYATGPHLDFKVIKNGRFVNPFRLKLPRAISVKRAYIARFNRRKEQLLRFLNPRH